MPRIAYMVIATLPSESIAQDYIAWLNDGHLQAVIEGGATIADVIRLDPDPTPRVMSRYEFPSREAFDRYTRETAPRLRAEGVALFGQHRGVKFERLVGEIL
jgi:hypothetical protein